MEKKFTKGNWSVDEFDSIFDECFYISDANGNWIATVIINFPSWEVETPRANAKLIAAAPEMLDVLSTIENDNGEIPDWLWKRIKDVIKKATE